MQSTMYNKHSLHVAVIMDGNGRWATSRGRPRTIGHRAGADRVRSTVEAAPDLGIATLTLFAFSADNWKRPPSEVSALMTLLNGFLADETPHLVRNGVRLSVIGRRDRLTPNLVTQIRNAEEATGTGRNLLLRIAVDYSSRTAIAEAAQRSVSNGPITTDSLAALISGGDSQPPGTDSVDLLIRTGGEKRLSDFLLWECAYAELFFSDVMWPDFSIEHFRAALADFHGRQRRFGAVPATQSTPHTYPPEAYQNSPRSCLHEHFVIRRRRYEDRDERSSPFDLDGDNPRGTRRLVVLEASSRNFGGLGAGSDGDERYCHPPPHNAQPALCIFRDPRRLESGALD